MGAILDELARICAQRRKDMKGSAEINHFIGIKGSLDGVYAALSTVEGIKQWWTVDTSGSSRVGGIVRFRFGAYGDQEMRVTSLKKNSLVKWICVKHTAP